MGWIVSNERPPEKDGYFRTADYKGVKGFTLFNNGNWISTTGHPIEWWFDGESEDERIDQLEKGLQDLIEAIPGQTNDRDWWPPELVRAVDAAKKLIDY